MHARNSFNEKKKCQFFEAYTYVIVNAKIYTGKYLVIMESSIVEFHQDFYIPEIKKLAFHLPHVCIIGTHKCSNTCKEAFDHSSYFQEVFCHRDDEERVVAIFSHQIQYEYYGGNRYVSIYGITLEHFSATDQETYSYSLHIRTRHAVFHSFMSDNKKRDVDTTSAHRKRIIELLKKSKI